MSEQGTSSKNLCQQTVFGYGPRGGVSYRSNLDFAVDGHRSFFDGMETEHCGLRQIDDGRAHHAAEDTAVTDSVGAACHVLNRELAIACLKLLVCQKSEDE
jgi:hypothetical protein